MVEEVSIPSGLLQFEVIMLDGDMELVSEINTLIVKLRENMVYFVNDEDRNSRLLRPQNNSQNFSWLVEDYRRIFNLRNELFDLRMQNLASQREIDNDRRVTSLGILLKFP